MYIITIVSMIFVSYKDLITPEYQYYYNVDNSKTISVYRRFLDDETVEIKGINEEFELKLSYSDYYGDLFSDKLWSKVVRYEYKIPQIVVVLLFLVIITLMISTPFIERYKLIRFSKIIYTKE
jgi:hypothetical protein